MELLSGTFYGADVAELRAFARDLSSCAKRLTTISFSLGNTLSAVQWHGPDSERFRREWNISHRRNIRSVCAELETAAQELLRNAKEQDAASSAASLDVGGGSMTAATGRPGADLELKISGMDQDQDQLETYLQSGEFQA
ncbi:WXG100 family type VII secretion target [Arthrobacter sp. TMN-49]